MKQDKRERAASGEIEYYSQQKPTEVFNLKRLTVKDLVNKKSSFINIFCDIYVLKALKTNKN